MNDLHIQREVGGRLLVLYSTNTLYEHGFCPSKLSIHSQGNTLSFRCIREIDLRRNLIWKSLMTLSYPITPIFGSQMQGVLTGGDPSAF